MYKENEGNLCSQRKKKKQWKMSLFILSIIEKW